MLEELTAKQEIARLLSHVTEQEVKEEDISHRILFVSSLVILLMGVMYADNQVTESEKQGFKKIIGQFIPLNSRIGQLIKPIFSGVQKQKTYTNSNVITKLSEQLKASEKLLIIGLCHEVAASDDEVAEKEEKYIQIVAKIFGFDAKYLTILFGLSTDNVVESDVLNEVHTFLDPHHFQDLDPAFMAVADHLRAKLPQQPEVEIETSKDNCTLTYEKLVEFQKVRGQLSEIAAEVLELIQQGTDQGVLSDTIQDEALRVLEKIKSQRFRLAVVGEFSQGKSTFLNALVGEEVQPTRAIPCSGTVTVLKYGDREKVVCRYKDGQEEEVPIDRYHELASISQEAALSNIADGLSKSTIREIVFEHPRLELCRHQVEIIDSPGLNEHPERTAITEQLLEDTDAAIFLANASRPLAQGERELIRSLHVKLRGDDSGQPAKNLFVLVNFMDLLRREKDQVEVKELFKRFLQGDSPIIASSQRLHFISAQSALDSIIEGRRDEFLSSFESFTDALQTFLTQERGTLVLQQVVSRLQGLIDKSRAGFKQTGHLLEGRVSLSEMERAKIIAQIGEASGREFKLRLLHDELMEESINAVVKSWEEWADGIAERIAEKSADWESSSEEKASILRDYSDQFMRDISNDLDSWLEKSIKDNILKPRIHELSKAINQELKSIRENLKMLDHISGSSLSKQFDLSLSNSGVDINFSSSLDPSAVKERGLLGNLGFFGATGIAGGLLAAIGVGFLPLLVGGFILGWLFGDEDKYTKMKTQVYEKGFDRFADQAEEIITKILDKVRETFEMTLDPAINAIESSVSILDNLLVQQDKIHEESVSDRDAKKEYLGQALAELRLLDSKLKNILMLSE